ncbi:hypothetical protein [Exiguobacterium sp. s133]|uniref:hypothetical protein n=1 Tax=Exiguobacterium sp. s133 TaxID=2751213 RepID=UPI001BE88AAF|nr:hypothetical protein [Exiguobacterium sp. s133]
MDKKMAQARTIQASCFEFISTLFPEETFQFMEEQTFPDAFGQIGTYLTFKSKERELKFSFVEQAHQKFDRVFLAEKSKESSFFSRLLEATYEEETLYIHHIVKPD